MPPRFDLKLVEFEFFKDCEEITKKKLPEICLLKTFWRVLDSINLYGKSRKGGRLSFICAKLTCAAQLQGKVSGSRVLTG